MVNTFHVDDDCRAVVLKPTTGQGTVEKLRQTPTSLIL
jgi:hypothetical protein